MIETMEMFLWIVGLALLIFAVAGAYFAAKEPKPGESQSAGAAAVMFFVFGIILLSGMSYEFGRGNAGKITDGLYETKSNLVYNGDIVFIVMKSVPMATTQENTAVITIGEIYATPFYYKIDKSKVDPTIKNGDMVIALDGFLRKFDTKN